MSFSIALPARLILALSLIPALAAADNHAGADRLAPFAPLDVFELEWALDPQIAAKIAEPAILV